MSICPRLWWSLRLSHVLAVISAPPHIIKHSGYVLCLFVNVHVSSCGTEPRVTKGSACKQPVYANVRVPPLSLPPPPPPFPSLHLSRWKKFPTLSAGCQPAKTSRTCVFLPRSGHSEVSSFTGGDIAGPAARSSRGGEPPNIPNDEFHFGRQTDR